MRGWGAIFHLFSLFHQQFVHLCNIYHALYLPSIVSCEKYCKFQVTVDMGNDIFIISPTLFEVHKPFIVVEIPYTKKNENKLNDTMYNIITSSSNQNLLEQNNNDSICCYLWKYLSYYLMCYVTLQESIEVPWAELNRIWIDLLLTFTTGVTYMWLRVMIL